MFERDGVSKGEIDVEFEHFQIHHGMHYFASSYISDMTSTDGTKWIIKSPTSKTVHLTFEIGAGFNGEYFLNEGVTAAAGTTLTIFNSDRNSANVLTGAGFTEDATVTANGTELLHEVIGSDGLSSGVAGGVMKRSHEWILKTATVYAIRFYNRTANCRASLKINMYSET